MTTTSAHPVPERFLKQLYHAIPRPPTTNFLLPGHETANPFADLPEGALVYDIGSKKMRGYNDWKLPVGGKIVTIDIDPASGADIVADAHNLHMIPDSSADCVVSICVIEHCAKPWIVMDEIHRILKPGGRVFIGVPFIFPFHADPHDNWRVTYKGIDHLCDQFQKIESGFQRGPASCMAQLNAHFLALLLSFNSKALYGVLRDVFGWALFWTKYLDKLLARHPMNYVIHAGVWFYGRKP